MTDNSLPHQRYEIKITLSACTWQRVDAIWQQIGLILDEKAREAPEAPINYASGGGFTIESKVDVEQTQEKYERELAEWAERRRGERNA